MMKRWILTAGLVLCGTVGMGAEMKIAVVKMSTLIKAHPDAIADMKVMEEQAQKFEGENREMIERLEGMRDAIEQLKEEAASKALSEIAREGKRQEIEEKVLEFRHKEREMRETATLRQRQILDQRQRMQRRLLDTLQELVASEARGKYTLVLDASVLSLGTVSPVVFHEEAIDITDAVLAKIEKLKE